MRLDPRQGYTANIGSSEIVNIAESTGLDQEEVILVLKALARHGLLEMTAHPQTYIMLKSGPYGSVVQLNRFGAEFVAACGPPANAENNLA